MKIGETMNYRGYTIKKVKHIKPYYIKECGVFAQTERQAKDFITLMGKDAITLKLDKVTDALNNYIKKGE